MRKAGAWLLAAAIVVQLLSTCASVEPLSPGETRRLSSYSPALGGDPADASVYILDSGRQGGTLLVVGGTHADEIAGIAAATMIAELAVPEKGRIIVVPCLNSSGLDYADATAPRPSRRRLRLDAASGTRYLRYGSRFVRPEGRGLPPGDINREYPGLSDGARAQRVASAVMALLDLERVDVAIDLHEAGPDSRLGRTIVANPKNVGMAARAVLALEDAGVDMGLERSAEESRGMSHREWGDRSAAAAFLVETINPAQAYGGDAAVDQLRHPEYPLRTRVAVQLEAVRAIVDAYNAARPERGILYGGLPGYDELEARGLEAFF